MIRITAESKYQLSIIVYNSLPFSMTESICIYLKGNIFFSKLPQATVKIMVCEYGLYVSLLDMILENIGGFGLYPDIEAFILLWRKAVKT